MSQAIRSGQLLKSGAHQGTTLPGLPQGPLSPKQQLEALRRTEEAAEERVKMGVQLFKAAEQHTVRQQAMVDQIKADQEHLREEIRADVARSMQAYDQWVGKMDEDFTGALKGLEKRIDDLQAQWTKSQERIDNMMRRSESLLDQSRSMVETIVRVTGLERPTQTAAATSSPAACGLALTASETPTPIAAPDSPPVSDTKGLYQSILERLNREGDESKS